MSAIVCGSKRSFLLEDLPSPPVSKRLRCSSSSSSPVRFSPPSPLHHLKALFPHVDSQLLERALFESSNDLDSAINSLNEHHLESAEHNSGSAEEASLNAEQGTLPNDGDAAASENTSVPSNVPVDGAEWVDLFVREMMSAANVDDARARASRVLEILERSISKHAAEDAAQSLQKENLMLKEHIEVLMRENTILKRAVAIQHERQKEFEDKHRELQQLVSQYQQQLKTLEVNNYALMMHLRQAQQSSPIPGRFHPDVF
ncbi:hypothetical protein P3X46_010850 [Hevea brasiliensis]|uniref:CUE domain-containing protein n=1 Tax=Hevea brasiliensis TaxID=3981 RepID=A0ABQ9MJ70_HEVBR|nr:uncharacterized protein LOC110632390 [Hevea brasiliensis]KAJ9179020.1 hypothetical protein P3X46_010850 [Hevea brasiliensis]